VHPQKLTRSRSRLPRRCPSGLHRCSSRWTNPLLDELDDPLDEPLDDTEFAHVVRHAEQPRAQVMVQLEHWASSVAHICSAAVAQAAGTLDGNCDAVHPPPSLGTAARAAARARSRRTELPLASSSFGKPPPFVFDEQANIAANGPHDHRTSCCLEHAAS